MTKTQICELVDSIVKIWKMDVELTSDLELKEQVSKGDQTESGFSPVLMWANIH